MTYRLRRLTPTWTILCSISLALAALGCGDDDVMGDGGRDGGRIDGGRIDGGAVDDGGAQDGGAINDGGAQDGGAIDDGGAQDGGAIDDGGTHDGGTVDAGTFDGGPPTSCSAAGGACIADAPGACADGLAGTADWYSCGDGDGVMCCLPANTPPLCRAIGTRSEGWYRPNGERICYTSCAGHTATCEAIGTRSEGWYTDAASAGCIAIPVDGLIEWTMCAP